MSRQNRAMRSGGLVAANHAAGAIITVASGLLLSKALGPDDFAIYALCTAMSAVLRVLSRLGIYVGLLTRKDDPSDEEYGTALTSLLIASAVVGLVAVAALPAIERFSRVSGFVGPGAVTAALLPLIVLPSPAMIRLERDLTFQPVILIEFVSQLAGQALGIGLAFGGWGVWGPITGSALRIVLLATFPWIVLRRWPTLRWNPTVAAAQIRYGASYLVANSAVQGRAFVVLTVVGRVMGQEAVGFTALAFRAMGLIAPFRAAVSRVILPAIGPIADVPARLRKAVTDAVETEMLLSIPVTVIAVAFFGPAVLFLLSPAWSPAASIFAWAAAAGLLATVHATAQSALHARGYFVESLASTLTSYVIVLALLIALAPLTPEAPGIAMLGLWPAGWVTEWFAHRRLGTTWTRNALVWAIGGSAACLVWRFGPGLVLVPLACWIATYPAVVTRARLTLHTLTSRPATPVGAMPDGNTVT